MTRPAFRHAAALRAAYPELVAATIRIDGVTPAADVAEAVRQHTAVALARLADGPEGSFPEIAAWRRVFARMGLKPTQYRCASEALLRRLRTEGGLPSIHPLVDLANAVSVAVALPIAVLDLDRVVGGIEVRHADGGERYETFAGEVEHPDPGEVIFADDGRWAHARRWTNRQSGRSAVRASTARVLVVVEGVHAAAPDDVPRAAAALAREVAAAWGVAPRTALLSPKEPAVDL